MLSYLTYFVPSQVKAHYPVNKHPEKIENTHSGAVIFQASDNKMHNSTDNV